MLSAALPDNETERQHALFDLAILDTATRQWLGLRVVTPVRSVAKGFFLASLPGLIGLWPEFEPALFPLMIAIFTTGAMVLLIRKIQRNYRGHVTGLWVIEGLFALIASFPAFLLR